MKRSMVKGKGHEEGVQAPAGRRSFAGVVEEGKGEGITTPNPTPKTYASISARPQTSLGGPAPTWVTPERDEVFGTVVRMEGEVQNAWKVVQKVKKKLEGKVDSVKAVRKTQGGAVIIESRDKDQHKLVMETLKDGGDLKLKGDTLMKPKVRITGVMKGYEEADIAKEVRTLLWAEDLDGRGAEAARAERSIPGQVLHKHAPPHFPGKTSKQISDKRCLLGLTKPVDGQATSGRATAVSRSLDDSTQNCHWT
nr:unnamed protein product [Callosobruchus analis]